MPCGMRIGRMVCALAAGRLKQSAADYQTACMRAALVTLEATMDAR